MSIDCAFFAFCAADAEPKVSKAGKNWTRLRVGVGEGDAITWLTVAAFGRGAEIAAEREKSDRCYVDCTLRLDPWRGPMVLSAMAFRSRPSGSTGRIASDAIGRIA